MAIQRRLALTHRQVFPAGAFLVSEVEAVLDFQAAVRPDGSRPQKTDPESGLLVWSVQVLDADEMAGKRDKTVSVKLLAPHQPVPPKNETQFPFRPVEFAGLTALPYVDETGTRPRITWSYRAEAMTAPAAAAGKAA